MSESDSEERDLWGLYGSIGNHRVVPLRAICRERMAGIDDFLVSVNLEKTARDARETANLIREKGGQERAAERAEKVADVFDYWQDNEEGLRDLVNKQYRVEHGPDTQGNPSTPSPDNTECPFENDPSPRSCWGCHAPRKVWQVMEREYDEKS